MDDSVILVIGGAGYIGSHCGWMCAQAGYKVIILDNLSAVSSCTYTWATFIEGDYGDPALLIKIFSSYKVDAVIQCAAYTQVGQSVAEPEGYYENNVSNMITLLKCMRAYNVNKLVFSSSAAVYGECKNSIITEDEPLQPISPYGRSKLMIEWALRDFASAYKLRYVALRYFNVGGAHAREQLGERHKPESHLIPLALKAADEECAFTLFGSDYPTPDGTCIRDYVHVLDIAHAHNLALEYLSEKGVSEVFNVGSGAGCSVRQVIAAVEKVTGKQLTVCKVQRRPGDPATLIADIEKAKRILGWQPKHLSLDQLVESAWEFFALASPSSLRDLM